MITVHPEELLDAEDYIKPLDRPTISQNEVDKICNEYTGEIKDLKEAVRVRDLYIETLKKSIIDVHKVVKNYSFNREGLL